MAEECEGLRQHEREIDRQQRLKLRGGGGRRVFPDAEAAAQSAAIGIAHLHRLAAADDALTIERAAEVPPDDRYPAMPSRQQDRKSGASGKMVLVRVNLLGRRHIKK